MDDKPLLRIQNESIFAVKRLRHMFIRKAAILAPMLLCSACGINQTLPTNHEATTLPDTNIALIKTYNHQGFILGQREFLLTYFDGVESENGFMRLGDRLHEEKILPGIHRLGMVVNYGDFCPPPYLGSTTCFNFCYSGVVLKAEAGRKYGFDIEKKEDTVNLLVLDDTNTVVSKDACKQLPTFSRFHSSKTPLIKSIQEGMERESKELKNEQKIE
jgi:hypothetical protein